MKTPLHAAGLAAASLFVLAGCVSESADSADIADEPESAHVVADHPRPGDGIPQQVDGEVKRYDYRVDLASGEVAAALGVDVNPPGGRCFSAACQVAAEDVTWNGKPAKSALSNGELRVCGARVHAGDSLRVGERARVPEQTFLGLDVGFSRKKDLAGGTFTYLLSWIEGCSHFGACDPDPSRLAEYHFEVAHAPGEVVLCPGKLTPGADQSRCDLSFRDGARALSPTYSSVGVASDPLWVRNPFVTSRGGLNVVFYEVPGGRIAASLDRESVAQFFDWITDFLGPFPYGDEIRFAGGPTHWLGFEHPANIILHEKLPTFTTSYANPSMHVVMHESTHQWAGNRATLAEVGDFVWKEATAEYLAYVFEREHRPTLESETTRAYWDRISLRSTHYPRPIDDPPPAVQDFYGDVYGPGPMVLYVQLEALIGKERVLDGIRDFLARPGARSVYDLRRAMERASGEDLSAYFDAWVFGKGQPAWPRFTASTSPGEGGRTLVTVTQSSTSGKLFGCVVEVEVRFADGNSTLAHVNFGANPRSATASASIEGNGAVQSVAVDPRHFLINQEPAMAAAALSEEVLLF